MTTRRWCPARTDVFDLRPIDTGDGGERHSWPPSRTLGAWAVLLPWCLVLGFTLARAHWRRRAADVLGARARAAARACAGALARGTDPRVPWRSTSAIASACRRRR